MKKKLKGLVAELPARDPGRALLRLRPTSRPTMEKVWAQRAGLGWIGKNGCLITPRHGSWVLLATLLLDRDLEPDAPHPERCGACEACLPACPTGAIPEPGFVDARRCLSFWTIERRGAIPPAMAERLGGRVFGCDDCQTGCPWNGEVEPRRRPGAPAARRPVGHPARGAAPAHRGRVRAAASTAPRWRGPASTAWSATRCWWPAARARRRWRPLVRALASEPSPGRARGGRVGHGAAGRATRFRRGRPPRHAAPLGPLGRDLPRRQAGARRSSRPSSWRWPASAWPRSSTPGCCCGGRVRSRAATCSGWRCSASWPSRSTRGSSCSGLSHTTPGHAALLYALTPIFVFLLARWRREERSSLDQLVGIALAFAGVVVVLVVARAALRPAAGGRRSSATCSCCSRWSPGPSTRSGASPTPSATARWSRPASPSIIGQPPLPAVRPGPLQRRAPSRALSPAGWGSLAYLVLLTSVVSYLLYYWALRPGRREPRRHLVQPAAGADRAARLRAARRPAGAVLLAGGAMVLSGVLLTQRGEALAGAVVAAWRRRYLPPR